jgi:hypothetical protein
LSNIDWQSPLFRLLGDLVEHPEPSPYAFAVLTDPPIARAWVLAFHRQQLLTCLRDDVALSERELRAVLQNIDSPSSQKEQDIIARPTPECREAFGIDPAKFHRALALAAEMRYTF